MKKTTLFVTVILLVCRTGDCQWYQKYFGASDPGILSQEQLDMALKKSKGGITAGTTLAVIGAIGIISGAFLFLKDYPDEKYPDQAEMGKKFGGAMLALVSLPPEIIGIRLIKKNRLVKSEIERFIRMEMQIGLCITTNEQLYEGPVFCYLPGVSINLRF